MLSPSWPDTLSLADWRPMLPEAFLPPSFTTSAAGPSTILASPLPWIRSTASGTLLVGNWRRDAFWDATSSTAVPALLRPSCRLRCLGRLLADRPFVDKARPYVNTREMRKYHQQATMITASVTSSQRL